MTCPEFISLIENHDIICVQESKLDDVDCVQINGFTVYTNNRKKITRYRSGGIALIIRNSILSNIEILKNESKLISWMKISKDLLLSNEDVYLGIIYNPPYRSKYAHEDPYLEIQLELDRVCSNKKNILLCGDWNSRTSTLNDYIPVDYFMSDHFGNFDLMNENDEILDCLYNNNVPLSRQNPDKTTNVYGYKMLEFCKNNNLFILNGRLGNDTTSSKFTCKDRSCIDYFVSTAFVLDLVDFFSIGDFDPLLSDSHSPVTLHLKIRNQCITKSEETNAKLEPEIRLWIDEKGDNYRENLNKEKINEILSTILNMTTHKNDINESSINEIVSTIEKLFLDNAKNVFGVKKNKNNIQENKHKPWFNLNCKTARNEYHRVRKMYNRNKTIENKNALKTVSKRYKTIMKQSINRFKTERICKLKNLKNAKPKEYWKIINSIDKKEKFSPPLEDLFSFFKDINAQKYEEAPQTNNEMQNGQEFNRINEEINFPITESEIRTAIKNLKNNKSSGPDNVLNEHLKYTADLMMPVYTELFNLIFDTGYIPQNWTLGNILPIYKNKGDKNMPENYRPITLLSCFGKLFTAIINNRLNKYAEEVELINSCQAGFRKGYSTVENIFIINSLIDLLKARGKKLYCTFIDFKQAFDKVWRQGLWIKMLSHNINGKCYQVIRNMYANIKSKLSTHRGSTSYFPCFSGVRQGENLSPFLFNLYLNDLERYLDLNGAQGIPCENTDDQLYVYLKIFILLYADDTVILSENRHDLQEALNAFEQYCEDWKLTVNVEKTKVLIFANGKLSKHDKYFFKGKLLEIVKEYKYLGIFFSKSGSFAKTKQYLSDQATKAMFSLLRKIRHLNLPIPMQIDLFNKTVKPILLYGSEIHGSGNIDVLERVQLKFLKYILNLKASTPSFMVYGETGATPLAVDIKTRIISFWTKLTDIEQNHSKTSTKMYMVLRSLYEQNKCKSIWLENVQTLINENGFGNIWVNQYNFNRKWFQQAFKQKTKDQYLQTWSGLVNSASSGNNYKIYKDSFKQSDYFSFLNNKQIRILTAYRARNHKLPIEVGRWRSIPINQRTCQLCNKDLGDEFHFLLACENFKFDRKLYIKPYYYTNPNTLKFNQLMNTTNKQEMVKLSYFVEILLKTVKAYF